MKYEYCCKCNAPTGKAGAGDDSLYTEYDGPFCDDCFSAETQPEAIRLAEYLETHGPRSNINFTSLMAATELRRLYAEIEALKTTASDLLDALQSCLDYGSMTGDEWVEEKARDAINKATS